VQGDPTTCGYIRPEVPNVKLEGEEHRLKAKKDVSCDCCSELKAELQELKQTLDSVVVELWTLKVKPAEPISEPIHEPKPGPKHIMIDYSVFVGFIGVLIGVVVAYMWKLTTNVCICGCVQVMCARSAY
jgi:hypothetical protein